MTSNVAFCDAAEAGVKLDYNLIKTELDPGWNGVKPAARVVWERVDRNWNAKQ